MDFPGNYRDIGNLELRELVEHVAVFGDDVWTSFSERQQLYEPHRRTQSIPLIYDEDDRHDHATVHPLFDDIEPLFEPVSELVRSTYAPGYFIRILLTRLAPRAQIDPHIDGGTSLICSRRIHVPLATNDQVVFQVGREPRFLAAGTVTEINNLRVHQVRNDSNVPRIHLIADWVEEGNWRFIRDDVAVRMHRRSASGVTKSGQPKRARSANGGSSFDLAGWIAGQGDSFLSTDLAAAVPRLPREGINLILQRMVDSKQLGYSFE